MNNKKNYTFEWGKVLKEYGAIGAGKFVLLALQDGGQLKETLGEHYPYNDEMWFAATDEEMETFLQYILSDDEFSNKILTAMERNKTYIYDRNGVDLGSLTENFVSKMKQQIKKEEEENQKYWEQRQKNKKIGR